MLCVLVSRIYNMTPKSAANSQCGDNVVYEVSRSVEVNWAEDDAQAESKQCHIILL